MGFQNTLPDSVSRAAAVVHISAANVVGASSLVLTVLALIASFVFYRRSLRKKEPLYLIGGTNIVSHVLSKFPGIDVSYLGNKVSTLTSTRLLLWNAGRETIQRADITSADPLRIECKLGTKILAAGLVNAPRASNQFSIEKSEDGSRVLVGFDYIDKDQGAIIEVLHTGSSPEDVFFAGDLKGAVLQPYRLPFWSRPVGVLLPLFPATVAVAWLDSQLQRSLQWTGLLLFLVLWIIYLDLANKRQSTTPGVPKAFRPFQPLPQTTVKSRWRGGQSAR